MKSSINLIFLFSFLMLVVGCLPKQKEAAAQTREGESGLTMKFIQAEALAHATIAVKAVDVKSGEVLIVHNPSLTMIPASIQKLLVTATALEILSPEYTFTTTLDYSGKIDENGTLNGDLSITGGGDPTLGSSNFTGHYSDIMERFAIAIKTAGIKKVEGKIIGDASIFGEIMIPDTWIWEDIGNYYGATATGLNIYDNSFDITFTTKKMAGTPATITGISPEIPGLEFENHVVAADNNRDNAYIYGTYLSGKRIIRGTIPANRSSFTIKGAIPDPAYLAAHQLTEKLKAIGIVVTGNPASVNLHEYPKKGTTLLEINSPTLAEIVQVTNTKSFNLYAETLLLHLSPDENALHFVRSFWEEKGMPVSGMYLEDGSGLSRVNGMTANQMIFLLQFMANQSEFGAEFRASLPVSGVSGNLVNFGKDSALEKNLAAKSGSMSRVLNYAGYLTTTTGREVTFVVMVNNYDGSPSEVRTLISQLMIDLAASF